MKHFLFKGLNALVLAAVLFALVGPVAAGLGITTSVVEAAAADRTGWDPSKDWYWVPKINTSIGAQLKRGNDTFYVQPFDGWDCHPLLDLVAFADRHERLYAQDVCVGTVFRVRGVSPDSRWVWGWVPNVTGGRFWYFPAYRLAAFIYSLPRGNGLPDCTGLSSDTTMNAVSAINELIKMPAKADKFDVQVTGAAFLLSDTAFAEGRRECLRTLKDGQWVAVRYTLNNSQTGDPVWAYVRLDLPDGTVNEGLVPTYQLIMPPATTPSVSKTSTTTGAAAKNTPPAPNDKQISTTTGVKTGVKTYKVQKGDSLSKIAKEQGTTVAKIVAANSDLIKNPSKIGVGWTLTIPGS